ncbi:DUF1801 domain-containing protein [Flavobacterium sp. DGU11]|uniref:DUF1801 domain-containing protein n=1 Tax=Flavobacterium arundinis TaxID=3139143 RepID=A0ABU9I076_9FLAO
MQQLHERILHIAPEATLSFLDGRNEEGKVVTNPNIGYGAYTMKYTDGSTREFYRVGLSATSTGISVYIMGLEDKKYLAETYGATIGKAKVTGYCIAFKKLADINVEVLMEAVKRPLTPEGGTPIVTEL